MKKFRSPQRPKKSSLVVGRQAVKEALLTGKHLDKIFLDTKANGADIGEIKKLAAQHNTPISYVPVVKLNGFNVTGHEGCIAQIARVQYIELQQLISFVIENGDTPLFLILDGITDIRNIGGIARTAFCCGVHGIIIPDKGVGALSDDAVLTSAGALEQIPVCRVNSLVKAVDELHLNGIKVLASEMTADTTIDAVNLTEPVAIVMGGEEHGIHPTLLKVCDEQVKIPMTGDFESLNVSVATGMILYETMQQRRKSGN